MAKSKTKPTSKKGGVEYADGPDTATLERPDSSRSQRALLQSGPADRALRQVNTPSAVFATDKDGGAVMAYAVTTQNPTGSEVALAKCPNGHGGDQAVASGTLGKTATCGNCGSLLVGANLVEARFGGKVTLDKDGKATVAEPTFGGAKASDDRGASRASQYATEKAEKAAARKGYVARKTTKKSSGGAKGKGKNAAGAATKEVGG